MAGRLMRERGFANFNMDELADSVGVSKPTLYQHFSSKDELVAQVIIRGLQNLEERLQAPLEGMAVERLQTVMRHMLKQRHAPDNILKSVGPEIIVTTIHSNTALVAQRVRVMELLGDLVEKAKAQGEIVQNIPTAMIVHAMFCLGALLDRHHLPDQVDLSAHERDETIDHVIYLFLHGITPSA
jgi:AcrR family transcriptional regulator